VQVAAGQSSHAAKDKAPSAPRAAAPDLGWLFEAEVPSNLLRNPGFEDQGIHWRIDPSYAGKIVCSIDDRSARSGRRCARLDIADAVSGRPFTFGQGQQKALKPGTRYFVRLWVRTQEFKQDGEPAAVRAGLASPGSVYASADALGAEQGWRCVRLFAQAQTEDLRLVVPAFVERARYRGTIWIDDAFVAPLPEKR